MHIEDVCTCPQWLVTHDSSTIYIFDRIKRLYTTSRFLATRTFAPQTAWVASMCPPCFAIWTPRRGCRCVPRMPRTWRVTAVPSAPFAHTNGNIINLNTKQTKNWMKITTSRKSDLVILDSEDSSSPTPKNWKKLKAFEQGSNAEEISKDRLQCSIVPCWRPQIFSLTMSHHVLSWGFQLSTGNHWSNYQTINYPRFIQALSQVFQPKSNKDPTSGW